MLVEWQLPSGTKARTLQREFFRRAINLLRIRGFTAEVRLLHAVLFRPKHGNAYLRG